MTNSKGKQISYSPESISEDSGKVVNGLWSGDVEVIIKVSNTTAKFIVNYTDGLPKVIYILDTDGNGDIIISRSDDGVLTTQAPKIPVGIVGFME